MINRVTLLGHLGRDPEIRSTASLMPVASFSLATRRRWKDRDGNRQEATEWHDVVCFGRLAEVAGEYLSCGDLLFVEGRLQTRSWEDSQTGSKRYRTEVICSSFQMLGGRTAAAGGGPADSAEEGGGWGEDDDVPF